MTSYSRAEIVNGTGWAPGARFQQVLPDGTTSRTSYSRAEIVNGTGWAPGARFITEYGIDIPAELIDTVTDHYLLAGLWCDATDDNGDEVTDAHTRWEPSDVIERDRARERVAAFLAEVRPAPAAWAIVTAQPQQAGHDLWLSAGGHGTGFWDRGHGLVGDYLDTAAQMLGPSHIFVGGDGPLYEAG